MSSDDESLKALESLMSEFFNERTTNERKRQIEELLDNFGHQRGAWKLCLYFLANTRNEYVMMYCLTVLEKLINRQWIGMLGQEKGEIRTTLYKFLLGNHQSVPHFIRNKLGKLVVDIGRLDWPHFYPDFFANILQLAQSNDTTALGLMMLQTASEEMACPRDDLSVSRKEELHKLLLEQVPAVLSILGGLLETTLDKHRHLVTATPPPSPTHGQISNSQQSLFSTSPLHTGSLLSSMFRSLSKSPFQPLPPLDSESHQLCILALNCLAQFFSWIPLSTHLTPSLLTTVFYYASFGCDPIVVHHDTTNKATLGILAMTSINEIMSKNCVPAEFEEFLLQMFQNTFHLLQRLTKDNNSTVGEDSPPSTSLGTNPLADLDENYIEKFTDFLRLFVSIHLRRFESNCQFPVLEFLALLFKYTFQQPTHDGFYSCLDIWGIFLDYLATNLKNRQTNRASILQRYKEALISLLTQVLRKLQFKFNQSSLEELDDEFLDDDSETEWQHFLRQCLEVVAKIAELMPLDTYTVVFCLFQENLEIYLGLESFVVGRRPPVSVSDDRQLQVTAENECRRLHCSLRDISSLLQAMGRLTDHFIGEVFWENFNTAHSTLKRLSHSATYSNRMKLYDVKTAAPSVLKSDFVEVHAQILATLKAFCHWLAQYYGETLQKNQQKEELAVFITSIVEASVANIGNEVPEKVRHSSAHLLMSITATVRPSFLLNVGCVQQLLDSVCRGQLQQLPLQTQQLVYRSVANLLLLMWPNVGDLDQEWVTRSSHYQHFIQAIVSPFRQVREANNFVEDKALQAQAKPAIKWTMQVLSDQIFNLRDTSTRSKQLSYQILQELVHSIVSLFPIYLGQPDVGEDILDFFLALFEVLRAQMGLAFAEQTIQTFLGLFSRDQLAECILHEGSAGSRVVEKFLKLLQQVVQEPGSTFKSFLPSSIDLCMDHIYPVVAERPSPDVKQPLFELLYQILLHNWRYFFKTNVVTTLGQAGNEEVQNEAQFTKIMQAYGQSFLQPDINIFRQNLECLESLNSKWKLYHKGLFKAVMLHQFLNVLLQTLMHRSHDLLQEEIAISVYNMACVDFEGFYRNFLPQFLCSCQGLDDNQRAMLGQNFKMEMDLPSFTQNIKRFVNDLRYYRLCNSSLPAGSVRFY